MAAPRTRCNRPVRDALIAFVAATAQAQAEGTKSAQRAGIDHKRRAQPNAYLGRKPSYDRATFDRIRLALESARSPSFSVIAKVEGLSKQTVFRLKVDRRPEGARGPAVRSALPLRERAVEDRAKGSCGKGRCAGRVTMDCSTRTPHPHGQIDPRQRERCPAVRARSTAPAAASAK